MSDGISKAGLARLHAVMAGHVERGGLPGLVTAVCRRGRGDAHIDAIGTRAFAGGPAMERDSIFRIASITKPITAVAALILVEECQLRLDDPVDALLPELANRQVLRRLDGQLDETVPARRAITLRDLLTFRCGWGLPPDGTPIQLAMVALQLGQGPPEPQTQPAPDEWLRRLGTLPLMFQPGERWTYNTGADILGVLIARAAGQPFATFLAERVFAPLGMKDTAFAVAPEQRERLVTAYGLGFDGGGTELKVIDPVDGAWSRAPAFPGGAAGLVSTVDDLLAFGHMLLRGGAPILSRAAVEVMTSDQLTAEQKAFGGLVPGFFDDHGWGFGGAVVTRRTDLAGAVGRFGWDGGFGTSWYIDPREQLVTVLLTQVAWTSPNPPAVCRDFWTCAYGALED